VEQNQIQDFRVNIQTNSKYRFIRSFHSYRSILFVPLEPMPKNMKLLENLGCRYSKEVLPNFNAAARSLLNGDLIAVNCDEQKGKKPIMDRINLNLDICDLLEIKSYPSFYVYEDGELILKDLNRTISDFRRAILAPKSDLKAL
jgi:hypothetical protein